jgi:mannose-1-phosphate guanylyltransferase
MAAQTPPETPVERLTALAREARALIEEALRSPAAAGVIAITVPLAGIVARRALRKIPLLGRFSPLQLLALAQVLSLARQHFERLTVAERRRIVVILRAAHGDPRRLGVEDRRELASLIAKLEPKLFVELAGRQMAAAPAPASADGRQRWTLSEIIKAL